MNRELIWDGLRVLPPQGLDPVVLDRGFLRLAGPDRPSVDVRFGPETSPFSPARDGSRILKACGLREESLAPCDEPWAEGLQGELFRAGRLLVLRFGSPGAVAAALFSAPPSPDLARAIMGSLSWTPPGTWREWRCFDMRFETPPDYDLSRAAFRPGAFRLDFARGRLAFSLDRLAPADAILSGAPFESWLARKLCQEHGPGITLEDSGDEVAFGRRPGLLQRLTFRTGTSSLQGLARHDRSSNKILILTERAPLPHPTVSQRLRAAYEIVPIQG